MADTIDLDRARQQRREEALKRIRERQAAAGNGAAAPVEVPALPAPPEKPPAAENPPAAASAAKQEAQAAAKEPTPHRFEDGLVDDREGRALMAAKLASSGLDGADPASFALVSAAEGRERGHVPSSDWGLLIRYRDPVSGEATGAERIRWLGKLRDGAPKYTQPRRTGVDLYHPSRPDWPEIYKDPARVVVVVEGELKAAATSKERPAVGLGGKDSSTGPSGQLLAPLARLARGGRPIVVAFDMDRLKKPDVLRSQERLLRSLTDAGASPRIASWDPAYNGLDDFYVAKGAEAVRAAIDGAVPPPDPWAGALVRLDLATPPAAPEWLWDQRVPMERGGRVVGGLHSPGSVGKTTLACGIAVRRALGRPFLPRAGSSSGMLRPGETVIVSAEDGAGQLRRVLYAQCRDLDLTPEQVRTVEDRVRILDLTGRGDVRLVASQYGNLVETDMVPRVARMIAEAVGFVKREEGLLVFFETSVRLGFDESNEGASTVMQALTHIMREVSQDLDVPVAAVVSTHVSKAVAREGIVDQHVARGGTAFSDNALFAIALTRMAEDDPAVKAFALQEVERKNLLSFQIVKPCPSVPPEDRTILERHPQPPWGAGLDVWEPPDIKESQRRTRERRETDGRRIAELVADKPQGKDNLATLLKDALGLSRDKSRDAINLAKADGWLQDGSLRAGGHPLLEPGPKYRKQTAEPADPPPNDTAVE